MKGLTHFISGIAAATFIPEVVHRCMAARTAVEGAESSFLLALAGLYAIMPDTLDFKLGRFFEKADVEVFPDPQNPDPQSMAEQLGQTMDRAFSENKNLKIQFHTIRISADRWRRYRVRFDTENQAVSIVMDEIVTTSQIPFPDTEPKNRVGVYKLKKAHLLPGSTRDATVDILSGPMFGFHRDDDHLVVDFLPWHRTWSHSYTLGLLLALPLWLLAVLAGWTHPWLYPLVAFLGFATHITEDLTGYMGGSLIWPFIRRRTSGLRLFHAANPDANFVTDWLAVTLIIFNLDRFGSHIIPLAAPFYFMIFFIAPISLYFLPRYIFPGGAASPRRRKSDDPDVQAAYKALLATEEVESEAESVIL